MDLSTILITPCILSPEIRLAHRIDAEGSIGHAVHQRLLPILIAQGARY